MNRNRTFTGHLYNQNPNFVNTSLGYSIRDSDGDYRWRAQWYHNPPCCTGNQARLLPNYIHHMWWGTPEQGLAATMYGPNEVTALVGGKSPVTITVDTEYPFEDEVRMKLNLTSTQKVKFPLLLKIPAWCEEPSLQIAGEVFNITVNDQGFVKVDREWGDGDTVTLALPAEIRATKKKTFADGMSQHKFDPKHAWMGSNSTSDLPFCVVERGSLTFALPLELSPSGPFNYAIDCNASNMKFYRTGMPTGRPWDWPLDAPVHIVAQAKPFPWPDAWLMPEKEIKPSQTTGPMQSLTLIP